MGREMSMALWRERSQPARSIPAAILVGIAAASRSGFLLLTA